MQQEKAGIKRNKINHQGINEKEGAFAWNVSSAMFGG